MDGLCAVGGPRHWDPEHGRDRSGCDMDCVAEDGLEFVGLFFSLLR